MPRNQGRLPEACRIYSDDGTLTGFRTVHVLLFGGFNSKRAGQAPWLAGSFRPPSTSWAISTPPHPFEIEKWELA